MKPVLTAALLGASLCSAQPAKPAAANAIADKTVSEKPGVKRAAMQTVEKSIDVKLKLSSPAGVLLGDTRGVYLEGCGAVFTSEFNVVDSPGVSPFHQVVTPQEKAQLRSRKLQQLVKLKEAMRAMLASAASELRAVPLHEKIVLGVTLFYWVYEDTTGLPAQIVMQASRQQLLAPGGQASIRTEEF